MKGALFWTSLACLLAGEPLQAGECRGIAFPDQVMAAGTTLRLNGLGVRKATLFKVNVYVAALYEERPSHDPHALLASAGPSELVLQFVRSVRAKDLRERWSEGFAKNANGNAPGGLPGLENRIATLNGWMSDIESGQRMTFIRIPGQGIAVDINGSQKGTVPGDDFARVFLSIWLGGDPPNPELKAGLLGGTCD
jgi:hypothetical protein